MPRLTLFQLITDAHRLRVFLPCPMGVHGLPVARVRWRGVPRSQRTCDMCDSGAVGEEHYFVFVCPALAAVRAHYAPVFARVQGSACFCLPSQPSYVCAVHLPLFPGSLSDLESVCWCPIKPASSGWTDVILFVLKPESASSSCIWNLSSVNVTSQILSKCAAVMNTCICARAVHTGPKFCVQGHPGLPES